MNKVIIVAKIFNNRLTKNLTKRVQIKISKLIYLLAKYYYLYNIKKNMLIKNLESINLRFKRDNKFNNIIISSKNNSNKKQQLINSKKKKI